MAFPDAPRVIYERTPSEEVISQLRFPAILRIESEAPAAFQERIRHEYPIYKSSSGLKLPVGVPPEVARLMAPLGSAQTTHHFTSRDEKWAVALTRSFIALTCRPYDRWENFREHLRVPLAALQGVYAPGFFTRIGLRYRDVIRRSTLGLADVAWADLLQPWVAGAFASPAVAGDVVHSARELLIRLPEGHGHVRVHHGTAMDEATKETLYVFDADFFSEEQMEPAHVLDRLNCLNRQARLFFRWCIRDRLHEAMRPQPVSDP